MVAPSRSRMQPDRRPPWSMNPSTTSGCGPLWHLRAPASRLLCAGIPEVNEPRVNDVTQLAPCRFLGRQPLFAVRANRGNMEAHSPLLGYQWLERVQGVVDGLGQLLADAGHLGELLHPGFFTSCSPPRYLSSACRRFGPTPECPPGYWWCGLSPVWRGGR